jgi:excisionase family DNA binding protein
VDGISLGRKVRSIITLQGDNRMAEYYSVEEVAELFGVNSRTVRNWINEGKLEAYVVGGRLIRVLSSSLDAVAVPIHRRRRN